MPGYFTDGTVDVELGQHVFVTPSAERRSVILDTHCAPASVMDSGGGTLALEVTGQRVRANLGDAERWAYELLLALAASESGTLGVEDERGNRATFADAVCVGASAEFHAYRMAEISFDFAAPERSAQPAWGAVPATPGTYGGTSTQQNYAAGGVALGDHPASMRIEMVREFPMLEVPRARGARPRGPARRALMRFAVTGHVIERAASLAGALETLARSIGPRAVALTGNGNTYSDVLLDALRPQHGDLKHAAFEAVFIQEVA